MEPILALLTPLDEFAEILGHIILGPLTPEDIVAAQHLLKLNWINMLAGGNPLMLKELREEVLVSLHQEYLGD